MFALLALSLSAPPVNDEYFEAKVRPILVARCLGCHGSAKDKGGLRLDSKKGATTGGDTGPAVVPGDVEKSLLAKAVRYDGDVRMPPKGKLPDAEIATVTAWVAGGAPWPDAGVAVQTGAKAFDVKAIAAGHWSFQPIRSSSPQASIDSFVLTKLEAAGLKPAAEADKRTLLRRLRYDLTGLPPTPAEIAAFLADTSSDAYAKQVDRLLASPAYGERWGRHWLDLARYADTHGHEFDFEIPDAWRYRDYVIQAFNDDIPFDQFAREQIAGDLLPDSRKKQAAIATGFWQLGEAIHSPVDVRQNQADRHDNMIDVFGKAFLGLTVSCARCHDHKFDPISAKDYYALYGVLSSSRYRRMWLDDPKTTADEIRHARAERGEPEVGELSATWAGWTTDGPAFAVPAAGDLHSGRDGVSLGGAVRSPTFRIGTKFVAVRVAGKQAKLRLILEGLQLIQAPIYGGLAHGVDHGNEYRWLVIDVSMWPGQSGYLELIDDGPGYFVLADMRQVNSPPSEKPTPATPPTPDTDAIRKLAAAPRATGMADGTAWNERVFLRGNPKVPGDEVPRRFLELFAGVAATQGSGRIELANAVTDPANPLTARVFVNRVWKHHFGVGLVPTPDDFGKQGTPPTHPELLDHLASEFVRDGWRMKALHRRILLSSTYRMASRPHPATADRATTTDPQNKRLHRANVRRLEAEAIRDAMLAVSGRLDRSTGGPGVPPHLTAHMNGRGRPTSSGPLDGNGRRSVYLQVRRNFLNPMFVAFDYPTPFTTIGRRGVSNVPAQALVMLNNPFVHGQADVWAKRDGDVKDASERVRRMYEAAFGRLPTADEVATAREFVTESPADGWAMLAHALFNAKEFIFVE